MKIIKYKAILLALFVALSTFSMAKSTAKELDHDANMAINKFIDETPGGDPFLVKAKAFLVFPDLRAGPPKLKIKCVGKLLLHPRKQ